MIIDGAMHGPSGAARSLLYLGRRKNFFCQPKYKSSLAAPTTLVLLYSNRFVVGPGEFLPLPNAITVLSSQSIQIIYAAFSKKVYTTYSFWKVHAE